MNPKTTILTVWQTKDGNHFHHTMTTLEDGIFWQCDWVERVQNGETNFSIDYKESDVPNPGKMFIFVNAS